MSKRQPKASYWQDAPLPRGQIVLIPRTIDETIPADHPVRMVDEILDQMDWKPWEAKYCGRRGQPPIHPSILCKTWLFALTRRMNSSRQVEYALNHSSDFIWLVSGRTIDHVTLSEFRRAHGPELRELFRQMVKLAMKLQLANLAELCIDGTRVLANSSKAKTWTAERLEKVLALVDEEVTKALAALEQNDAVEEDLYGDENPAAKLPKHLADMQARRRQLAEQLERLKGSDEVRSKRGGDAEKNPAQLPKTDPDSRILPNKEGGYAANYTPMVTVETQGGFIVEASVVIGNNEHEQVASILNTIEDNYSAKLERVLVDSAYTTGENLAVAQERQVDLIGPLVEPKSENNPAHRSDPSQPVPESELDRLPVNRQTNRFDKLAFHYVEPEDCYYCPAGKQLKYRTMERQRRDHRTVERRIYTCRECKGCPLADRCRQNPLSPKGRELHHDIHEDARRRHRRKMLTPEAKASLARRSHAAETPFAVIKALFGIRRFLLRGIAAVNQEWLWCSSAFNLKKLISMWPQVRSQLGIPAINTAQ